MNLNLIIDGNYLMSKNVFPLHKNNLLFGAFYNSLEMSIAQYRRWYPFTNIYFVSDSRSKSWRKNIYPKYKENRKKDSKIDWEFVYNTYDEFKSNISKTTNIKVLEGDTIEGDDLISYLVNKSNSKGESNLILSNDYDIKQLINYNINPLWINIMTNEMMSKKRVFIPENYQIFLDSVNSLNSNDDIFSLNDNVEFIHLFNTFLESYEVDVVNSVNSLIIKLISGDVGDNISSAWFKYSAGKKRGIGAVGALSILNKYIKDFGDPLIDTLEFKENLIDIIIESKKLNINEFDDISKNLELNRKLISLNMNDLPKEIVEKMENIYVGI